MPAAFFLSGMLAGNGRPALTLAARVGAGVLGRVENGVGAGEVFSGGRVGLAAPAQYAGGKEGYGGGANAQSSQETAAALPLVGDGCGVLFQHG